MSKKFKYIDLFAGCGGLSLGLEKAGFHLEMAVEKSDMAAETFYHNFIGRITDRNEWLNYASPESSVQYQASRGLVVKELSEVLKCKPLMSYLRQQDIDLVAGGPPCQGFSLAGRRNPEDLRNKLPWEFLDFVDHVRPKAVIIENVSGIAQDFKKHNVTSPFDELREALKATGNGYQVQQVFVNAKHFGVPQHRPRVLLVALRKDIAKSINLVTYDTIWKSEYDYIGNIAFSKRPLLAPKATHFGDAILTVADAVGDLSSTGYSKKKRISSYASEMREDTSWMNPCVLSSDRSNDLKNHTLRSHSEQIETRFRLYQYFRDNGITSKVMSIGKSLEISENERRLLILEHLAGASFPAKAPDGAVIAYDVDSLVSLVFALGTKKHSQRALSWDLPSPTVVSLPDDYVHPQEARTLTVREMARFQSFPDAFEFRAKETTGSLRRRFEVPQYTQVGNAVPPKLAYAIGKAVFGALTKALQTDDVKQESYRQKAVV